MDADFWFVADESNTVSRGVWQYFGKTRTTERANIINERTAHIRIIRRIRTTSKKINAMNYDGG